MTFPCILIKMPLNVKALVAPAHLGAASGGFSESSFCCYQHSFVPPVTHNSSNVRFASGIFLDKKSVICYKYANKFNFFEKKMRLNIAILICFCTLIFSTNAFAYLDPGTGSYILQAVLGLLAASFFTLKHYWHRIKGMMSKGDADKKSDDAEKGE